MVEGVDITGDAPVLLRDGEALAFPQKFYAREDSVGRVPRLRASTGLRPASAIRKRAVSLPVALSAVLIGSM
jgi:hypothetical protein